MYIMVEVEMNSGEKTTLKVALPHNIIDYKEVTIVDYVSVQLGDKVKSFKLKSPVVKTGSYQNN